MSHKFVGFSETLDDDDYGLIVGIDGELKGIWVPVHFDSRTTVPDEIARLCKTYFGLDPNDETCYSNLN